MSEKPSEVELLKMKVELLADILKLASDEKREYFNPRLQKAANDSLQANMNFLYDKLQEIVK